MKLNTKIKPRRDRAPQMTHTQKQQLKDCQEIESKGRFYDLDTLAPDTYVFPRRAPAAVPVKQRKSNTR